MADDRYGYWLTDMSSAHRGPTTAGAVMLFVGIGLILYALLVMPGATTQSDRGGSIRQPACVEQQRLERHGVTSGPSYRTVVRACREASHAP